MVLLQSFATLWISVGFYANREIIAKTQCENRFLLNNACQGQCVLMKKLRAQEEKEKQRPDVKFKEAQLFAQPFRAVAVCGSYDSDRLTLHAPYRESLHAHAFLAAIFHPPAA